MKALRIELDFTTGKRPGGINPRRPGYPCGNGWQDTQAGIEIRMVVDGDVDRFRGVEGIEILEGAEAIDAAVALLNPTTEDQYTVTNEPLLAHSMARQNIETADMGEALSHNEELEILYLRGASGITKIEKPEPAKAADVAKGWQVKD